MIEFTKPQRLVNRVFLHCSASDNPHHDNIKTITEWHLQRGFTGIGYHYFISKDGVIHIGRNIDASPAAQVGHNKGTIAICLHGLEKKNFTDKQFASLKNLCECINIAYDGKITFHGHREVSNKDCPVFDYKKVLNLDHKGYIQKGK
jgi:N-acetyl-anhydromuramyl-L-alanine amidase AmpD